MRGGVDFSFSRQVNAPESVPSTDSAVRGNINSLVFLEPIDALTTRVRYVVEVEPKGWLPSVVSRVEKKEKSSTHPRPDFLKIESQFFLPWYSGLRRFDPQGMNSLYACL